MRPFAAVVYRGTWLSGWWCNEPITDVVRRLNLSADGEAGMNLLARSAVTQARQRVGGRPSGMALPPDRTDRGAERYLKDDWHGLQLLPLMAHSSGHLINPSCVNIMGLPTHPLSGRTPTRLCVWWP